MQENSWELISETDWSRLCANVQEAGVGLSAMPVVAAGVDWVVLGKCHLQLFGRLNLNTGLFGPLINIVDSFWRWTHERLEKQ